MATARARDPAGLRALDLAIHFFDAHAAEYESWAGGVHRRVARRLVELAAPAAAEACLDVGCGTGLVSNALGAAVGRRGQVVAIDVSAAMLARARRRARANTVYQKLSATPELWFRDGTFDLVVFGDSLPYLGDPMTSLMEARRVLRPGGRVAIAVHRRSLDTLAQDVFFGLLDDLQDRHAFALPRPQDQRSLLGEPAVLEGLLREAGFTPPRVTTSMTGGRVGSAEAWVEMMAKAGPRPFVLLSSLGPAARRRVVAAVAEAMDRLGEEGLHYHSAYTFAVAVAGEAG
ncbi:MAG: methyltransferase domain-containing protein [Candidatus Dormibacteraeota bacterium]|nr:methyltransferase domain-containing protein [Candidatus Dormibacteraeota bacterium]